MSGSDLLIIIQARMTSTRLPGKVMLPLCDSTVLGMMIERLAPFREQLVIATTDDGSEKAIDSFCEAQGIRCFRGNTDDVLGRFYGCATAFGAEEKTAIVRLTSDCPLIDPEIVQKTIDFFYEGKYDYASNTITRTFPRGMDCEVFSFSALKTAHEHAATAFGREHVTPYIHTLNKAHFSIGSFEDTRDASAYRLTLDEEDDYRVIEEVYLKFDCRSDFDYDALLAVLEANPYIAELNAHVEQKKQ